MRRWTFAIGATLLACVPIAIEHATSPSLLADSDTSVLLKAIRERHAPLSWFVGDWPLQNHFYRPLPTLTFDWDNHLYGSNAAGYGWTNDILCILCVLLLLWFVRELTDRPAFAGASAVLFASCHWGGFTYVATSLGLLMWVVLAVGIWRHKRKFASYLPVFIAIPYLATELMGKVDLQSRMIAWLPGRTASVMTVFALISMAAYARYERLTAAKRPEPLPTPLTPPATRNTLQNATPNAPRFAWGWLIVSVVGLVLALASYEQAVVVPATLSGVAICLWLQGYRPRWGWQVLFWGSLAGYALLRHAFIPSGYSGYQLQQFRHGPGVFLSITDYVLPVAGSVPALRGVWDPDMGVLMLTNAVLLGFLYGVAETVGTIWTLKRKWVLAFTGWALSWGTYFPMAWLKQFDHYHYWPMAMRSIFVVALGWAVWEATLIALRPPAGQAPPRPVPAPGSLPHP